MSDETNLPLGADATQPEPIEHREGMFGVRGSGDTSGYGGLRRIVSMPGGSEPPYGGWFDEVANELATGLEGNGVIGAIEKIVVHAGEITFYIRRGHLAETA